MTKYHVFLEGKSPTKVIFLSYKKIQTTNLLVVEGKITLNFVEQGNF